MDNEGQYSRIEFLSDENERGRNKIRFGNHSSNQSRDEDNQDYDADQDCMKSSISSSGSSPPKDFDINYEQQYLPIYDDNNSSNFDANQQSSSLASSLSTIESNRDYDTSSLHQMHKPRVNRCPVCEKPIRTFYCAQCIQKGHFVSIETPLNDKRYNLTNTCLSDRSWNKGINRSTCYDKQSSDEVERDESIDEPNKVENENLQLKLRTLTRKTGALESLYNNQKMKLEQTRNLIKQTQQELDSEKKATKSKERKIELIKSIISSRKKSVDKRQDAEIALIDDTKQYVSRRIYQLTSDVFPIEEINLLEQNTTLINMETSPLLTFSDGSHHQIDQQTAYSIVEPWLPSNGDYSAYSLWVNDNRDHIPASMSEFSERNPAFRISAALAYTNQLVNNMASYLDVILPAKLDLETFNRELLNDIKFTYNVAKLNANVIHLCVTQGVDVSLLNPFKTLKNLMLIFNLNVSDIGRKPIIELDNEEAAKKIEEQLENSLSLVQEDIYDFSKFDDVDDVSDSEWEISETINPMEMQMATEQSIQQNSYISRLDPMRLFASFWSTGN